MECKNFEIKINNQFIDDLLELEKLTKEQVVKDAGYKNIWEMISDALKDIFKSIFKIDKNKYNALIDSQQNLLWFLSSDNIKPAEKEKTKKKIKKKKEKSGVQELYHIPFKF